MASVINLFALVVWLAIVGVVITSSTTQGIISSLFSGFTSLIQGAK